MATDAENLATAKSNLLAAIALHGHKPSYSIDGESYSWGELWDRIDKINAALGAELPVEIVSDTDLSSFYSWP